MSQPIARILMIAVLLFVFSDSALAAPCGTTMRRVALVIGTADYPGKNARLLNAVRDARLVAATLVDLGFETTVHENVSRNQLLQALQDFRTRLLELCENDLAVFYYAGRGAEIRRMGFLFTTDMDVNAYYHDTSKEKEQLAKAVLLSEVLEVFEKHSGPKLIIVDTCRVDVHQDRRGTPDPIQSSDLRIRVPDNTLIAYATEPLTFAQDGPAGGHGPYALALVTQLRAQALPVEMFFRRVRETVAAATKQQQLPFIDSGTLFSDVRLGRGAPSLHPVQRAVSTSAVPGRRVALVVGVSNYWKRPEASLQNPRNDAAAMATALNRLGFAEVMLLQDPSQEDLIEAASRFERLAAQAHWGVVYFAGHAVEMDGHTFLLPSDAEIARDLDVPDVSYALNRFLNKVDSVTGVRLVIVDACRDDPFPDRKVRATGFRGELKNTLSQPDPGEAVLVAYASKHGQMALDGLGQSNSPFTTALLAHIEQPNLEIGMLFRKVRDRVRETTGGMQLPFTYGSLPAQEIYFQQGR